MNNSLLRYKTKPDGNNNCRWTGDLIVADQQFASISIWLLAFTGIILTSASLQTGILPHPPLVGWLALLLGNIISPFSEEIMFRGFILNKLMGIISFGRVNFITSILFVAIHLPYWLWARGFNERVVFDLASVMILSLFVGYLYKKFNSLTPSILTHIINNIISNLV